MTVIKVLPLCVVFVLLICVIIRWKRGHLVPSWKFRRFELRQNGTLAYYKGNELKGKIRLRGCNIVPTEALEFQVSVVCDAVFAIYPSLVVV